MNLPDWGIIYFPSFQLKDDKIGRKNKQTQNRDPPSFQPELRKSIVPDYSSNPGISEEAAVIDSPGPPIPRLIA